jgi:aminoglycoside phosphotransferase (APT) family kinase protein
MAHNQTGDLARGEALATAFLDEYRRTRHLPASLPYYAAFYAIKRLAEASKASGAEAAPLEAYYLAEFGRWEADGLRALDEAEHDPPVERRHVSPRASRQEPGPSTPDDLRYVLSTPPGEARCAGLVGGETTVVQDTGTGRVTLRYVSADQQVLFAKLYSDGLGEYSFRLQKALWHNGFGAGSRFQVPEPLAFFPQRNLMLMRGVAGTPLGARLNGHDSTACVEGTRQAARWLAALHQSSIRIGTPEPDWDSLKLFRICVRLLKAAAKQPGQLDFVLDLMDSLKRHLQQLPTTRPLVQTHGRFHQDHVFLHGESIAVIDLDRSRPADPAKDVAEFIRVLRWTIFKTGGDGDLAHAATQAFLAEYLGSVPAAAASVRYYWFAFLMLSVLGTAGKLPADHPRRQPSMDFFMRELKHVEELRL